MGTERSLNRALAQAVRRSLDGEAGRCVIVCDQHLGDGKRGSDDFRRNRDVYKVALRHYFEQGHHLISVGDAEELWECDFPAIIAYYPDVYAAEKRFLDARRLTRICGNHDIFWRNQRFIARYLKPALPGINMCEALLLAGKNGETIFIAHGHQGEFFSDLLWPVTRVIVRSVWKPLQRLLRIPSTHAARNIKKRNKKEQAYYAWAKERKVLFIAGHTHRAMFSSLSELDRLRMAIDQAQQELAGLAPRTLEHQRMIEKIRTKEEELARNTAKYFRGRSVPRLDEPDALVPCYFNAGCCSYTTGMTAVEIDCGTIRLVKWDRSGKRTVYEEADLGEVLRRIQQR